jgi:DNA-binding MarR family transcriptional regulator
MDVPVWIPYYTTLIVMTHLIGTNRGHSSEESVGTDERVVDAVERIILAGVAITARALDGEIEDLTFPQWRVLTVVGEHEANEHVGGVGRRIGVSAPSASRLLRRLEDRGLIELQRDVADRRYMRVRLTEAGQAARGRVIERRRILIRDALGGSDQAIPADTPGALSAIGEALMLRA